jgi:hypothetical protein
MPAHITYGQLRTVLTGLGFRESRSKEGVALQQRKSDTIFLFRPYEETDRVKAAEVSFIRKVLDERGLLEPESFDTLLTLAPAS